MYKVAIIGAGPAGIAMGAELVASGVPSDQIVIFEKTEQDNGSVRQFYPAGKDINSVYKNIETEQAGIVGFSGLINLDQYHTLIQENISKYDLNLTLKTEVQKVVNHGDHFDIHTSEGVVKSEKVVLSSGVFSKPRRPDYPIPAPLLAKVSFDIMKLQKENTTGKTILVVGGGDSASEYAQTLAIAGNKVILSYRQDNFFRMNQLNKDRLSELEQQGSVEVLFSTNITEIGADNEQIKVSFKEDKELLVDNIVYSLGGASPAAFMDACGVDYDDMDVQLRDNHETNIDGLYMIGDLASGRKGGSLMLAFNGARSVLEGLHKKYNFPAPK